MSHRGGCGSSLGWWCGLCWSVDPAGVCVVQSFLPELTRVTWMLGEVSRAAFQLHSRTLGEQRAKCKSWGFAWFTKPLLCCFFLFFFLFRFPTALPSWDLATSFPTLQLFILTTRAAPWRIGLKQTTTAISLFLSSPTSLFVFFVFSGRFFERITGLQQKQLQQIPCGLRM